MKHLGIILASIILVLALSAEAKKPYAKQIKQLKKELAQIEKDLEALPNSTTHPRIVRERERLQNEQIGVVEILQQLDPDGDYSAYLPKSDERSATGNDMTENRAEPEAAASEAQSKANPNEEITLTVTSDGATKDEAIKNALRTAVEQTYGVFVSANTDILNDELIKDEIATVSSGNIKKFTEVAYTKNDNSHTITLDVTVSKGKLISYVKSKGLECEIDGASMFADLQLRELNEKNEKLAIDNLITDLKSRLIDCFEYSVEIINEGNYDNDKYYRYFKHNPIKDCRFYEQLCGDSTIYLPIIVRITLNDYGVKTFKTFINNIDNLSIGQESGGYEDRVNRYKFRTGYTNDCLFKLFGANLPYDDSFMFNWLPDFSIYTNDNLYLNLKSKDDEYKIQSIKWGGLQYWRMRIYESTSNEFLSFGGLIPLLKKNLSSIRKISAKHN